MRGYRKVMTRDGSTTFYNERYKDYYHSKTVGAIEEAWIKYVMPIRPFEGMKVLDLGFGLGYNSLALISLLSSFEITAIEKDAKVLKIIEDIDVPEIFRANYLKIRSAARSKDYRYKRMRIKINLGDAKDIVKILRKDNFDGVMFDPFSPKKNPELWTSDVFKDIFGIMKRGAILATYSCARAVRENLQMAGFRVFDGPVFGRRGPATVALKH